MSRLVPAAGDPPPEAAIAEAAAAFRAGRPVVVPTDTVYGIAVDPWQPGATELLFEAKRRPRDVPLAVLVADVDQARELMEDPGPVAERLMSTQWPGGVTVVVRRRAGLDLDLGAATGTIGLRCPDHPVPLALTRRLGPLATTSANLHGEPTPPTPAAIAEAFGDAVALVLDAGPLPGTPSTVVDCSGPEPRILREGPVAVDLDP